MWLKASLILMVLVLLTGTSCTTSEKIGAARSTSIYGPGVMQKPVLVDLEVSENKVTGQASGYRSKLYATRSAAINSALKASNADVLVEPVFETEIKGGKIVVSVSGYPAVYKNFRPVTAEDIPLLETGVLQRASITEATTETDKKKGKGLAVLVVLLVLGVGAALSGTL